MLSVKTWLRVRKCEQGHKFIINIMDVIGIKVVTRILDGQNFSINTFINCISISPKFKVFIGKFNEDLKTVEISYIDEKVIFLTVDIDELIYIKNLNENS